MPRILALIACCLIVVLAAPSAAIGLESAPSASTEPSARPTNHSQPVLARAVTAPTSARVAAPARVAAQPSSNPSLQDVDPRPNIVLLMIDDFPAMDARVFERLPNIKALFLDQGVAFSNYWANFSLCCPGRAAVLTGQTAAHNGVTNNDARLLDPRETIATELQASGYHTIIAGKYLNGTRRVADKSPDGWDAVAIKDDGPYFDYPVWVNDVKEYHGHLPTDYSTRVMAEYGVQLLREAPPDKPVFAFFTPNATHGGRDENHYKDAKLPAVEPGYVGDSRCAGIPPWMPASYNEADISDKPAYVRLLPLVAYADGWPLQKACEALLSVDDWLGETINELKAQGRYDNTLFVLTTDNGMGWGAHRIPGKTAPYTAQMPLYVSWPAVLGGSAPTTDNTLVTNIDLAPTFCELGGCVMGPYPNGYGADGQSFAGLIDGARYASVPVRNSILIQGQGGGVPTFRAILTNANNPRGQWLLVKYLGQAQKELYDMSGGGCVSWIPGDPGDPCMLVNVANSQEAVRKQLLRQLAKRWAGI